MDIDISPLVFWSKTRNKSVKKYFLTKKFDKWKNLALGEKYKINYALKVCVKKKSLKAAGHFLSRQNVARALATKAAMTYKFDIDISIKNVNTYKGT